MSAEPFPPTCFPLAWGTMSAHDPRIHIAFNVLKEMNQIMVNISDDRGYYYTEGDDEDPDAYDVIDYYYDGLEQNSDREVVGHYREVAHSEGLEWIQHLFALVSRMRNPLEDCEIQGMLREIMESNLSCYDCNGPHRESLSGHVICGCTERYLAQIAAPQS